MSKNIDDKFMKMLRSGVRRRRSADTESSVESSDSASSAVGSFGPGDMTPEQKAEFEEERAAIAEEKSGRERDRRGAAMDHFASGGAFGGSLDERRRR